MENTRKTWLSLGAALLTSTSLVTTAFAAGPAQGLSREGSGALSPAAPIDAISAAVQLAAGEGGESGEGGEGGEAGVLLESQSAYLTQLGLMRGHLLVGVELYRLGDAAAATHMKHPEDELYAAIREALEHRGAAGFEAELEALARSVETKAPAGEVEAAYAAVVAAIDAAESAAGSPSAHEIGAVIHALFRNAAAEYEEAVADGRIVEGHEYQDALGFIRVAEVWLPRLRAAGADASVVRSIGEQIEVVRPAWPSVVPPEAAPVAPSVIFVAAARVEIATLQLPE